MNRVVLAGMATGVAFENVRRKMRRLGNGEMMSISVAPGDELEIPWMFREVFKKTGGVIVGGWKDRGKIGENCVGLKQPMLITDPTALTEELQNDLLAYDKAGNLPATIIVVKTDDSGIDQVWAARFKRVATTNCVSWPSLKDRSVENWRDLFHHGCETTTIMLEALETLEGFRRTVIKEHIRFTVADLLTMAAHAVAEATNNGSSPLLPIKPQHVLTAWIKPTKHKASPARTDLNQSA